MIAAGRHFVFLVDRRQTFDIVVDHHFARAEQRTLILDPAADALALVICIILNREDQTFFRHDC